MNAKPKWRKVGWRSIRHNHYPDMVVRFGNNNVPKPKVMDPISSLSDDSMHDLLCSAVEFWMEQKRKESNGKV